MRRVAIGLHDVSPFTLERTRQLVRFVEDLIGQYVPMTLLVIPHHHRRRRIEACRQTRGWIDRRLEQGDEIALHGLWHIDDARPARTIAEHWQRRVLTNGEGEFSTLDVAESRVRIEHGLSMFARCGWRASGFVPPAWQLSVSATAALNEYPLRYFTTRNEMISLPDGAHLSAPALSLSSRSPWRRRASIVWSEVWARTHAATCNVRLAVHPSDAAFAETRATWKRSIDTLADGAKFVVKSELLVSASVA